MKQYGLPLDNRKAWAELPWSFWTASLTGEDADFQKIFDPIYDYVNATPSRVPFPDFYWTDSSREAGMHARPVTGRHLHQAPAARTPSGKNGRAATPPKPRTGRRCPRRRNSSPSCPPPTPSRPSGAIPSAQPAADWFKPEFTTPPGRRANPVSAPRARPAPSSAPFGTRRTSGCAAKSNCPPVIGRSFRLGCITTRTRKCTSMACLAVSVPGLHHGLRQLPLER